ncbi:MAG: PilZ domain-containing protein [Proteobacteria bacterium]|nr:PilZ domain-containing protein [Pseudomonadota bacterium]MBU1649403.1 PilZ domain-containing protein [Pseudomonadota bacterium]
MNDTEQKKAFLQNILSKLALFFPNQSPTYTLQSVEDGLEAREILLKGEDMLPYLQTAFFDDKIVEVELDGIPRVYFSRVHDHTPDLEEVEEDGEMVLKEPDYKSGDYLKEMSRLILLPLEPGMGNMHIRNSQKVLLRLFTSKYALELGTFCEEMILVRELPVLRLTYPVIGRMVPGVRAFRAKVPSTLNLLIIVFGKAKMPDMYCKAVEVSADGMSFLIQKKEQQLFRIGESRSLQFVLDDILYVKVTGIVRHVSKIRGKGGTEFRCGVQFELTTRAMAASIETLVATIQRTHLQELTVKSEALGIDLTR